jgi:hypothetical protein
MTGFACTRGYHRAPCQVANCGRPHEVLCDYPLRNTRGELTGKTCCMRLCRAHAKHSIPDIDLCPVHAKIKEKTNG